jgi:transcriptional regulator with XRE-family HTH domain
MPKNRSVNRQQNPRQLERLFNDITQSDQKEIDVGGSLRRLREDKGLTIRSLAEDSGLSVNTLSLIENGKTSPSVGTLQQLAIALQVPITSFFETEIPKTSLVHYKAGKRPRAAFESGYLEHLGAGLRDRAFEPILITLEPLASSGPQPIVHTGYEFVYCIEGRLTYTVEDQIYLLEPGDSLLFEARLPHRWQNVDTVPSYSLLVLCPGDQRDRPAEVHFIPE